MTRICLLTGFFGLLVGFSGCSVQESDYDLIILSPHQEKIEDEFGAAFADWYQTKHGRRPRISWRDMGGGASTQERFITDRFAKYPEGIGIDVFFGGGMDPHMNLTRKGLLAPYRIPNLDEVAPDVLGTPIYDEGFHHYGAALSGFGVIYNRTVLKEMKLPEPTSWEVLTLPALIGKVGAADPTQSGSALAAYEIILQAYGWDRGMRILTLMAANARSLYPSAGDIPDNIGLRQIAVGCAIDFYATNQIETSGPEEVGFCLPENLTVVNPDSISILKGAPHMETAQEFVAFVMSKAGQQLWFLPPGLQGGPRRKALYRMPVIPSLYEQYGSTAVVDYNPFKFTKSFKHDADLATRRRDIFRNLFLVTLIRPHDKLQSAWAEVIKVTENESLILELVKPPVTEKELLKLADREWTDPAQRSRLMTEWANWVAGKYAQVSRKAKAAASGK